MIPSALFAALAMANLFAPAASAQQAGPLDRTALFDAWQRPWIATRSLRVLMRVEDERAALPPGHHLVCELLIAADALGMDFGHGTADTEWKLDYWRQRSFLRAGQYKVHWPNKLAFEARSMKPGDLPERFAVLPWFRASGFWPQASELQPPSLYDTPVSLANALEDERYVLHDPSTVVHGSACRVLEWPGRSRISLDVAHGYAVRAWRFDSADGATWTEVEVPRIQHIGGGLYVPSAIVVRTFDAASVAAANQEYRVEILSTSRDDVSSNEFGYALEPGALRIARGVDEEFTQAVPGGLDFLLRNGDRLAARFEGAEQSARGASGLLMTAGALVLLTLAFCTRGQRARVVANRDRVSDQHEAPASADVASISQP